jgi:hypothetical protein
MPNKREWIIGVCSLVAILITILVFSVHANAPVTAASNTQQNASDNSATGLSSTCTPGYSTGNNPENGPSFTLSQTVPSGQSITAFGYQLTFQNNSTATVNVTGFVVAFLNSSGTETGNASENSGINVFILPGQSWTFSEYPWFIDPGDPDLTNEPPFWVSTTSGNPDLVDSGATCQLVNWYTGGN